MTQNSSPGFSVIPNPAPQTFTRESYIMRYAVVQTSSHTRVLYKRERALELILRLNSVKMRCIKEQEAMQRAPEGRAQQGSPKSYAEQNL